MTRRVIPSHPMVKALTVVGFVTLMVGGWKGEIGATAMESLVWVAVGLVVLGFNLMVVEPWTEKKKRAGDRMHPALEALDKLFEVMTGALGKILLLVFMTLIMPFVMIMTAYRWAANAPPIRWIAGNRNREWKDSKPHGQGSGTNTDGYTYTGEWKDGEHNGQGIEKWADGTTYTGEYKDGLPNGQGTYTGADGITRSGEWKDGKLNGHGTDTLADGSTYTGAFKDFMFNGQGTFTGANGDTYIGEFKDNLFNGQGTMTNADGTKRTGEWKDGELVP